MLKSVAAIRRRPGMSLAEFREYYENGHGSVARANKLFVVRYVQNHVFDAAYGTKKDKHHLTALPRDGVTELYFENRATMAATFSHPYVREVVGPDGANFSDLPTALSLLTRTEGTPPAANRSAVKALWFLKAAPDLAPDAFIDALQSARVRAEGTDGIRATVFDQKLPPVASGGSDYFGGADMIQYDGYQSLWFDSLDPGLTMRRYIAAFEGSNAAWYDSSRSFWLLVHEVEIFNDLPRS